MTRSNYIAIICALFLAEISATFESTMIYAALPTLIREFGDPVTAGWLVTIHLLIGAAAAVMAGRLGDIFGRRRVMQIMIVVALLGSIISAVTDSYFWVLVGRALQGLSVAVIPLTIGILRENVPENRLPVAIGLMTTAQGVGAASGLVLGGLIVDNVPWHWLFVASAALLAAAWVAVQIIIPAKPGTPPKEPINWTVGIMPVPGIAAILLGISFSKVYGWGDIWVLGPVIGGIAIMAVWAMMSLRTKEPFIDLRMLGIRNVALANAISILLACGTMQVVFVFSSYVQSPDWTMVGLGLSATIAGLAKLPSNVLSLFAGPFSGWLMQKSGMRVPVLAGGALAGLGWVIAMGLPNSLVEVIIMLCVISFGTTILNAAIPNIIVASVPENRTSEAIGTMSVIRSMATAIGAQVIAVLLATETLTSPDGGADFPSATGYQMTMGWIAALTIGAALLAFLLIKRNAPPVEEQAETPAAAIEEPLMGTKVR